jgi:hypothetical protein
MMSVPSSQALKRYAINVSEAVNTNSLFPGAGDVSECHIRTNATINSLTGDFYGNIVIGEMPFAQAVQNNEQNLVYKDGIWHDARRPYLYPPGQVATVLRPNASRLPAA